MEIEEEDRLDTWVSDAESAEARGMVGTARAVLAYALKVFPDQRNLWRKAADLEKAHGTKYESLFTGYVYYIDIFLGNHSTRSSRRQCTIARRQKFSG
jgi:pre-mRNA-processing factor 6